MDQSPVYKCHTNLELGGPHHVYVPIWAIGLGHNHVYLVVSRITNSGKW